MPSHLFFYEFITNTKIMAIKVNEHLIPDWAIERQAQTMFEQVAKSMPDKPREVVQLAALDLARDRMVDQALMAQESQKREYIIDAEEVNLGMKKWISQNGGKLISNISSKTNYFIAGKNIGPSKYKKVLDYKIPILSESDLIKMLKQ